MERNDSCVVPPGSNVTFLPLLSGSGASGDSRFANPAGRDWAREQPEFVAHKRLQKKQYNPKKGGKSPLVKVLEILKNFFQEVFKWGLGQSPEVFRGLPEKFCRKKVYRGILRVY